MLTMTQTPATGESQAVWQVDGLSLTLSWAPHAPAAVASLALRQDLPTSAAAGRAATSTTLVSAPIVRVPLVEVCVLGHGHAVNQATGLGRTRVGARLRVREVDEEVSAPGTALVVVQTDPVTGALVTTRLSHFQGTALQAVTTIANHGTRSLVVESVTSVCLPLHVGQDVMTSQVRLHEARSGWMAEGRWVSHSLSQAGIVVTDTAELPTPQVCAIHRAGQSTWTTNGAMPAGIVQDADGTALMWQIDAAGAPWRWELDLVGARPAVLALRCSGPTLVDHAWEEVLEPGQVVHSASVSVCLSSHGVDGVAAAMTVHRRARRTAPSLPAPTQAGPGAPAVPAVIVNDYMNTLNGNPTAAALEPLIDAAAQVGAEVFCIDAGWYDDEGDWWPTVGEWRPSSTRFDGPDGLARLIERIRDHGMVAGLWLELESVGVASPVAHHLPHEAFLRRHGVRLVENQRYVLDMTHPAARAHVDAAVERVVAMGVGMLKLDHNVAPSLGGGHGDLCPGTSLARHAAAWHDWLASLRSRYPSLLVEGCSSGAMRADSAMTALVDLQSTSDQQNCTLYPPIAVSAPMLLEPERCGNWGYPQPGMSQGEALTTLVTSMAGHLYLSGHLDAMSPDERARVAAAVASFKRWRPWLVTALPSWPLGLPSWDDDVMALALRSPGTEGGQAASARMRVAVWNRARQAVSLDLPLAGIRASQRLTVELGPSDGCEARAGDGVVHVTLPAGPTALLIEVRADGDEHDEAHR